MTMTLMTTFFSLSLSRLAQHCSQQANGSKQHKHKSHTRKTVHFWLSNRALRVVFRVVFAPPCSRPHSRPPPPPLRSLSSRRATPIESNGACRVCVCCEEEERVVCSSSSSILHIRGVFVCPDTVAHRDNNTNPTRPPQARKNSSIFHCGAHRRSLCVVLLLLLHHLAVRSESPPHTRPPSASLSRATPLTFCVRPETREISSSGHPPAHHT